MNNDKLEVPRELLAVIETFISSRADSFPKISVPCGMRSEGLDHASKELRAILAKPSSWPCWSCKAPVTMASRADADGNCPHCETELDLEDWPISGKAAARHQGEPVAWTSEKPTAPGAYWARGNGLERNALIEVIEDEGELRCNLHQRTTDYDFGYGYSIEQLSGEFEWSGPLYRHPAEQPALVAVVLPELCESDVDDLSGSFCQEALSFGLSQDVFARLARTVHRRTLDEVTRLNTK